MGVRELGVTVQTLRALGCVCDGQWELRLERNGERVLVGQGELKPVAGALYVGAEATMQGLSTAAELNGATAKVLQWDEAKDRWARGATGCRSRPPARAKQTTTSISPLWVPGTSMSIRPTGESVYIRKLHINICNIII